MYYPEYSEFIRIPLDHLASQWQEDMPELIPDIMTHYELPWRLAFGAPYKGGVISYIGSGRQSTPLHFDDLENLVSFYLLSTNHYNPF